MRYVAIQRVKVGDWVEPGQPVPILPGHRYDLLVRHGKIAEVPETPHEQPGGGPPAPLSEEEVRKAAADLGFDLVPTGTVTGMTLEVTDSTIGVDLPIELLEQLAASRGFVLVPAQPITSEPATAPDIAPPAENVLSPEGGSLQDPGKETAAGETEPTPAAHAAVAEIPTTLPDTRAALQELANTLGLTVAGTGSKGYVKESDLVAAIEAERARRAGAQ